jgi:hypothetical protein
MNRALAYLKTIAASIAQRTVQIGERVRLDASVLDRSDAMTLAPPGLISANGSARMIKTKDGWIAANLPREEDLQSVPALLQAEADADAWSMLAAHAPNWYSNELAAQAALLGLAVARIGETPATRAPCKIEAMAPARARKKPRVIDFSSLWAGPLCGAVFASMGADVVKIESIERPDTTAHATPLLDQRLNGAKQRKQISIASGAADLLTEIAQSDMLITGARARALNSLGLTRERVFAANPALIWVAITGHGWDSNRIAFGDDAAASGGLVKHHDSEPHFIGDAIADPLTGLAAADAALAALQQGHGAFIDAALARTAYAAAIAP